MDFNNVEVLRNLFKTGDDIRDAGLTTPDDIVRHDDIQYGKDSEWNVLDVYHLEGVDKPSPTIISIHGGGWVYGDKERYQHYCMSLAQRGFTVVNFTYRLAPDNKFPCAVEDINSVFEWVANNGEKYNIDTQKVFTVGDSAGGQLSSQYVAIFTNPEYQKLFDFKVPSDKIKILGCAFNCGIYDINNYVLKADENNDIIHVYFNKNDEKQTKQIDVFKYVTDKFPPSYVMTAVYDMIKEESEPFYELLKSKNVPCEFHIYGEEGQEYMAHVFHLDMRLDEAKECNDNECNFFKEILNKKY